MSEKNEELAEMLRIFRKSNRTDRGKFNFNTLTLVAVDKFSGCESFI